MIPKPETRPGVYIIMSSAALSVNWSAVLLAAVVAFIIVCTLISVILKELYRRY